MTAGRKAVQYAKEAGNALNEFTAGVLNLITFYSLSTPFTAPQFDMDWEADPSYPEHVKEINTGINFGALATGGANVFAEGEAASVLNALGQPEWADTQGGFVNWLKNLSGTGTKLTGQEADAIINEANRLGVNVRLDPPHPGTNWEVSHLNIGSEGQVHLEVPSGYDNPTIPKGSVTKPR